MTQIRGVKGRTSLPNTSSQQRSQGCISEVLYCPREQKKKPSHKNTLQFIIIIFVCVIKLCKKSCWIFLVHFQIGCHVYTGHSVEVCCSTLASPYGPDQIVCLPANGAVTCWDCLVGPGSSSSRLRGKIRHETTAVLERITLNKLQRPCSDLCDLLFVSLDYTGGFREEISLDLVILLSRRLCLPVSCSCLLPLPPSPFSFFFLFNPGWFRLWFSPTAPPTPHPPSLQFLRGPHIWFLSCLLLLLFPIHLSHRSAASPFFLFCFSIPVCNSLSLVALILPPTAPRNALPFLSLDLLLRVSVFPRA